MYASQTSDESSPLPPEGLRAECRYQRWNLESDLQEAIRHRELEVYYQPKVSLVSGMMRGVEALLRWRHPVLGLLVPGLFLPLAETTGTILAMDQWILEEVCRQATEWLEPGFDTPISINLSARDLLDGNLPETLVGLTASLGIPAKTIELEVTEPRSAIEEAAFLRQLGPARKRGVRIILDGFGGGSCSLEKLAELPLDGVKIDRSLINRIDCDEAACKMLAELVDLARRLGLETVAEGVERESQANRLKELGITSAQGYYYAEPGPTHRLEYWMEGRI